MLAFFVVIYLMITVGIGFYATRFIKNTNDFVNTGRGLPFVFNAFALFALWFGAETVFGASGRFVEDGILGVIEDPLGSALCLVLYGLFLARPLYKRNILTLGDLFAKAYGKKAEIISSILMLFTFFGFVAAQLVALAISLNIIFGIDQQLAILLSSIIVTIYTFFGGMWAISISDFIQSIVIILGLGTLAFMMVGQVGGIEALIEKAPENHFQFLPEKDPHAINEWVSAWIVIGLGSLASQDIFQRINASRNIKSAVRSTYAGAAMYLVFSILPLTIALCARLLYPEILNSDSVDLQEVIPQMVLTHSPLFVQIMFFGALLSAIMSTCSGALLAPSTILAENIVKPLTQKTGTKLHLATVKISILVVSAISTLMAMSNKDIYELVGDSSIVALVCILIPTFAAIYHKRPSIIGAFGAMTMGLFIWATREYASFCFDFTGLSFFDWYATIPVSAWIIGPLGSLLGYFIGWTFEILLNKRPETLPEFESNVLEVAP
ncbi:MAG: sodium:solute symporter family protein [Bacteroidales bacterium]